MAISFDQLDTIKSDGLQKANGPARKPGHFASPPSKGSDNRCETRTLQAKSWPLPLPTGTKPFIFTILAVSHTESYTWQTSLPVNR
jgi:hypothetical protein